MPSEGLIVALKRCDLLSQFQHPLLSECIHSSPRHPGQSRLQIRLLHRTALGWEGRPTVKEQDRSRNFNLFPFVRLFVGWRLPRFFVPLCISGPPGGALSRIYEQWRTRRRAPTKRVVGGRCDDATPTRRGKQTGGGPHLPLLPMTTCLYAALP